MFFELCDEASPLIETKLAQICGPSLVVYENHWEMLRVRIIALGNCWEMVGTETPQIWSLYEQGSEQLSVGPLFMICWQMVR